MHVIKYFVLQIDSIGVHRVENVSHTEVAVSLHLYIPPFDSCHCIDERSGHKKKVRVTFTSKYGEKVPLVSTTIVFSRLILQKVRSVQWKLE